MTRADDYRRYINSQEWRDLRSSVLVRADGSCEMCGAPAANVHHLRYPKRFDQDHPDSLLAVCRDCHDKLHGVVKMPNIEQFKMSKIQTPSGELVSVAVVDTPDGPVVYMEPGRTLDAMEAPVQNLPNIKASLANAANALKSLDQSGAWRAEIRGRTVYRPQVFARAMEGIYNQHRDLARASSPPIGERPLWRFLQSYEGLRMWLWRAGELALAAIIKPAVPTQAPALTNDDIIRALASGQMDHSGKLIEHDGRLNDVERTLALATQNGVLVGKDPEGFATARDGCVELGIDPSKMPGPGRQNLEALAGTRLANDGAEQGPRHRQRLSGCAVDTYVNTYRRRDVHAMILGIVQESES